MLLPYGMNIVLHALTPEIMVTAVSEQLYVSNTQGSLSPAFTCVPCHYCW